MRNVLHHWPNHKCKEILSNTVSAMTEDSVILIDEIVLPEQSTSRKAAQLDMNMLTCHAGMERSESEWRSLLQTVGLNIEGIWKYSDEFDDCLIMAVPEVSYIDVMDIIQRDVLEFI